MKNHGLEIERKFLLHRLPDDLDPKQGVVIRQGYLSDEGDRSVRLRQSGEQFFLTCKQGRGVVRREVEITIDQVQFEALWPLTESARVSKIRYRYPLADGLVAELDVFDDSLAPLQVVEVEFDEHERAMAFEVPGFFGPDVTTDARFLNSTLAREGLPAGWETLLVETSVSQ